MESKMEPENSIPFAQKITTNLSWNDIILDHTIRERLEEISKQLIQGQTSMKTFFFGSPGTGKTLAAMLIGKTVQRDVYRVDLSRIVSKHIDETKEKLDRIFDTATNNGWILFFDEADALFGKRSSVKGAHDRYANQEVAYLLQKIEEFPGILILTSNSKENMDNAFIRRFQSIVNFKMPSAVERYQIWKNAFAGTVSLNNDIDLHQISEQYKLSGGSIMNVARYCALSALRRNDTMIKSEELLEGVKKEFKRENKKDI
ncbi:MAG: ATP-binding protein [Candidatus Pedobacter colombiensis]|uniref:ATP-binding protein n=1 Tax=Candidatus Pedobacter colombiensis TaxID=3121371 RepID=A0AAJ5W3V9_9SPHI|nr:ATP-binding protein [Pedobacter sp.]WEK18038.1 MAG: ATP-binding protein [Pedobacter sp.]